MINGLDVGDYAGYVETVRLNQDVEGGLIIDVVIRASETATAVIYINYDACIEEIMNALAYAMAKIQVVREAEEERIAAEAAFRTANPIVNAPQVIGGITFTLAGAANFDTRNAADMAVISGITNALRDLTIAAPTFVTGVTFSMDVTGAPSIQTTTGENATSSVTPPEKILHNIAVYLLAAMDEDRRQTGEAEKVTTALPYWATTPLAVNNGKHLCA